ncbi:MAG: FUSC family protein [Actinomycetia bacterium]|nr:FUSC family protein [Actinomycetes bacterium]
MAKLGSVFASTDDPLGWRLVAFLCAGAVVAGLAGFLVDTTATIVAVAVGAFLGMLAAVGPLFLALRGVATIGLACVMAVGLAGVSFGSPWFAALVLAVLAFVGSLWSAVPVLGQIGGGFPALLFLLLTTDLLNSAEASDTGSLLLAAVIGVVAAMLVAVVANLRDPRKVSRLAVAKAWGSDSDLEAQGAAAQVLRFDGSPAVLANLLSAATVALLGRQTATTPVQGTTSPGDSVPEAIAAATQGNEGIQQTLLPRGTLTNRDVSINFTAIDQGEAGGTRQVAVGLSQWSSALRRAQGLLSGEVRPKRRRLSAPGLLQHMVRKLLSPDVSVFRFGVQRALALGLGLFVLLSTASSSAFWILLTVFVALQASAGSTMTKVIQRVSGTLVGALLAASLASFVPAQVLLPWVAVPVLLIGVAYIQRNYTIMAGAVGAGVVWVVGIPQDSTWFWAGQRALDTVVGAAIALLVARFVLPVRAYPQRRIGDAVAALRALCEDLVAAAHESDALRSLPRLEARVAGAMSNLKSDLNLLPREQAQSLSSQVSDLREVWDGLNALALLAVRVDQVDLPDRADILHEGVNRVSAKLDAVAAAAGEPGR